MITEAVTDVERREAQRLFAAHIPDISPNAVPAVAHDYMYAPVVACFRDPQSGNLAGAALACRAPVPAQAAKIIHNGGRVPQWAGVIDKHLELDLMAVAPAHRGRGIGAGLLAYVEGVARGRGVRLVFGNVTSGLDVDRLRDFYSRHGFTVLPDGRPMPPLLGKTWLPADAVRPVFYFYKLIKPAGVNNPG